MKGKMLAQVLLMLFIGAVFFSALGELVNWRIGSPLAQTSNGFTGSPPAAPVEALGEGVRQSLAIALDQLQQQHRTQAVKALDAAKRAADVARHGVPGELACRFDLAYRSTEHVRAALQDGEQQRAEQLLVTALSSLPPSPTGHISEPLATERIQPGNLQDYTGARVINAQGVRIGEVERIQGGMASLRIGSPSDVLGFIDLGGGKLIQAPVRSLVFGKRTFLGSTMVALPTFSTTPPQVSEAAAMKLQPKQVVSADTP